MTQKTPRFVFPDNESGASVRPSGLSAPMSHGDAGSAFAAHFEALGKLDAHVDQLESHLKAYGSNASRFQVLTVLDILTEHGAKPDEVVSRFKHFMDSRDIAGLQAYVDGIAPELINVSRLKDVAPVVDAFESGAGTFIKNVEHAESAAAKKFLIGAGVAAGAYVLYKSLFPSKPKLRGGVVFSAQPDMQVGAVTAPNKDKAWAQDVSMPSPSDVGRNRP